MMKKLSRSKNLMTFCLLWNIKELVKNVHSILYQLNLCIHILKPIKSRCVALGCISMAFIFAIKKITRQV